MRANPRVWRSLAPTTRPPDIRVTHLMARNTMRGYVAANAKVTKPPRRCNSHVYVKRWGVSNIGSNSILGACAPASAPSRTVSCIQRRPHHPAYGYFLSVVGASTHISVFSSHRSNWRCVAATLLEFIEPSPLDFSPLLARVLRRWVRRFRNLRPQTFHQRGGGGKAHFSHARGPHILSL